MMQVFGCPPGFMPTGEAGAWRPVQTAGGAVAEAGCQVDKHHEEQRGRMDLEETVLHSRLSCPIQSLSLR